MGHWEILRHDSYFAWGNLFASDAAKATLWRVTAARFMARSFIFFLFFPFLLYSVSPIFVDSMTCETFQFLSFVSSTFWHRRLRRHRRRRRRRRPFYEARCGAGRQLFVLLGTSALAFVFLLLTLGTLCILTSPQNSINSLLFNISRDSLKLCQGFSFSFEFSNWFNLFPIIPGVWEYYIFILSNWNSFLDGNWSILWWNQFIPS